MSIEGTLKEQRHSTGRVPEEGRLQVKGSENGERTENGEQSEDVLTLHRQTNDEHHGGERRGITALHWY